MIAVAFFFAAQVGAVGGDAANGDIWGWFLQNVTVQGTLNITGLVLLVILFSRDLILTKGQHLRRIEDLEKGHGVLLAEIARAHEAEIAAMQARFDDVVRQMTERYAEMKESRDYYREARITVQEKNGVLVDQLVESNGALQVAARAFGAFEAAAASAPGGA